MEEDERLKGIVGDGLSLVGDMPWGVDVRAKVIGEGESVAFARAAGPYFLHRRDGERRTRVEGWGVSAQFVR